MARVKIITESNCDMPDEVLKSNDIDMVSQYVTIDDVSYKDRVDMTGVELMERVSKMNKLPKTAAPSPTDFSSAFKNYIENGDDIICVCTSHNMSATYQNATIAAKEFPEGRIEVVDSLNISMGIGILVLTAVDCVKEGMDIHQTAEILREKTSKVKTIMILDTLEFMRKGGRCTAIQSFMGDILKIRPVIGVIDAKLTLMEKIRGKREKALAELMNKVIEKKDNLDQKRLIITHALGHKDSLYVKEQFEKLLNVNEIMITETGCSVSSHCGPNTIGIIYMLK